MKNMVAMIVTGHRGRKSIDYFRTQSDARQGRKEQKEAIDTFPDKTGWSL